MFHILREVGAERKTSVQDSQTLSKFRNPLLVVIIEHARL